MYLNYIWDWLGGNAAEIIASCALIFTTYQAYLSRKHNRISVRPKLALQTDRSNQNNIGSFNIKLSNSGLGPAVIDSYIFELDGKAHILNDSSEALEWVLKLAGNITLKKSSINLLRLGHVLSVNESINILCLDFKEDGEKGGEHIENLLDRISLKISYSSMYEERFEYHSIETHKSVI